MTLHYNDTPIYYNVFGKGPALILLHGFLESSIIWNTYISEFSKTRTVIIIDLPGHGKSGCISHIHTMELMADVLNELLVQLKILTTEIMGHSMGGYVALAFAEKYPDSISRLVLLNSTPAEDSKERKINRDRAVEVISKNKAAFITMAIGNLFTEQGRLQYASEIEQLKKEANQFTSEGIIAAIKGMKDRKDSVSVLKNFSKEKLMICGKEDPIIPFSESKNLSEKCNVPLKILSGGHMSWLENYTELMKIYT